MSNVHSLCFPSVENDGQDALRRYETMPVAAVEAELRAAGIDPAPTIAAVQSIVREHRERVQQAAQAASLYPPDPS